MFIAPLFLRFYLLLERGEGRKKERERYIDVRKKHWSLLLTHTLTGDQICNLSMCPDQESNWRPFSLQGDAQPTEPHRSGLHYSCNENFTENCLNERKNTRGEKNGSTLHSVDCLHRSLNRTPLWVSTWSLAITRWNSQTLSVQAAEYMFFSFHPKWKSKGTEVTEGVQIDLTQFLPKNYFSPSWIDSTFPCQVSMRWDLGGCLADSNLVQETQGPGNPRRWPEPFS